VSTYGVFRLQDGKPIAHYAKPGADSVLRLHTEGSKQP
jgi:hypothetical protein